MIRVRTTIKIAVLSMMFCAYAAQWEMVASNADEQDFIDLESVKAEGDLVYYTKKTLITGPNNGYRRIYGKKAYATYVYTVENCKDNTSKILNIKLEDPNGKDIMSATTPSEVEFIPIIEATTLEKSHEYACRNKVKKEGGFRRTKPSTIANFVPVE
jgi:hypothetical protein